MTPNPKHYSGADLTSAAALKTAKANILNEITNLLKGKIQDATVYSALSHAKNIEHDINSRHDKTEILLKNISSSPKYLKDVRVKSDLIAIALQSCDTAEDNAKHFRIKRDALECLKPMVSELDDDFYEKNYRHIKTLLREQWKSIEDSVIMKLDQHFNSCEPREKFRLLETLLMCLTESNCVVDISVFHDFPPNEWCKELLIYYLLSNNETWDINQTPCFVKTIHELHGFMKKNFTRHSIEDVLEIVIKSQNKCRLDIQFIIYILTLLGSDVRTLEVITRGECVLPLVVHELELLRLKSKCEHQKILYDNEEQLVELHELLHYSDEIIDCCLGKIEPNTHIIELIDFFVLLKDHDVNLDRKVEFLRQLGTFENGSREWKNQLFRELVDSIIQREFSIRECTVDVHGIEEDDKTYFSSIEDKKQHTNYDGNFDTGKTDIKQLFESNKDQRRLYSWSNIFKRLLESEKYQRRLYSLFNTFNRLISTLASDCQWSKKTLDYVEKYIKSIDTEEKIAQLNNSLEILVEYEIDIVESNILEIISQSNATNVQDNIHKFVIGKTFPGTYKKSLDQLVDELLDSNDTEKITLLNKKDNLLKAYREVMNTYNGKSTLFPDAKAIKDWKEQRITEWNLASRMIKATVEHTLAEGFNLPSSFISRIVNETDLSMLGKNGSTVLETALRKSKSSWNENDMNLHNERIAVIRRTAELTSGIELRDIQLLSFLLMINSEENRGRLAQINTGEGKTIVIAMIAAYHGMKGHHVDIITSSPQLAIPQSEAQKPFFAKLGLTVDHNFTLRSSYQCDVLYGTAHEFQGDILRDEFHSAGIRGGRTFDIVIVDEVDNMLVDGNNYIVLLSSNMPGMDHLETLLAAIYAQVKTAAASIIERDGQAYFQMQENAFGDDGKVKNEVIVNEIAIEGTKREFVQKSTELHVRSLIRDCDISKLDKNFPEIKIPKHLRSFICNSHLKKWIEKAVWAKFFCRENEEYIIRDRKIKIVDAKDTGVVRENSHWSNGLHQFLEIKHGAKINPESLTSNYISNVGFFRRYRPKIYGLTGTLGSNGTKELLCKTYDVDTIVVPPFKSKQYKELKAIVTKSANEWYTEIAKSCLRKLKNGRAVLIIMEYIRETEELEKVFKERFQYESASIKLYKTDTDSSAVEKPLKSGEVVITTNIAGRGTDIKLSKDVDENGGLHVCVTFLPKNSRVELQNIGRTSRTGNRGTGQFVVCTSESKKINKLRQVRAIAEEKTMRAAETQIARVTTKDTIFERFSKLIKFINGRNENTKKIEQLAVEERFAIWLQEHDEKMDCEEDAFKDFETFRETILRDEASGKLINNPYMHVKIGNEYLDKKEYKEARDEYTLAIDLDEHFAEHAHYNRGYAMIAEYGNDVSKNQYNIDKAIDDFKHARKLIEERESCLHLLQSSSDGQDFSDHVTHKLNLYNVQKHAIDLAIGPDFDTIERQIKELKDIKKSGKLAENVEAEKEYTERMKNLKEQKKKIGVIHKARSNGRDIEIERITLEDSLPNDDFESHKHEITEFERNGYIGGFQISEIPPIDWNAVIGLLALGIGQLLIGAALAVFTLGGGASFAASFIAEGISDIITAVRDGIINRTFSWATWLIEKAISLTVSIACAGWNAMKDVAKTAYAGAKTAASIGNKVITETVKSGWKLVAKKVGLELAKGVGKEIATKLIDYGIDEALVPTIQQEIIERIEGPIQLALLNNHSVKRMLELDEMNKNHYYEDLIMRLGHDILNPGKDSTVWYIATQIATRIAANKSSWYSVASKTWSVGRALYDLYEFTDNFIDQLNSSISNEAERHKIDQQFDVQTNKTTTGDHDKPCKSEQSVNINDTKAPDGDINLNRLNDNDTQIESDRKPRTPKGISKVFVKAASTNMMGIIKGKIIAPAVQAGVDYSIEKITSSVTNSMNAQVEDFRAHKRIIHDQNEGFKKSRKKNDKKAEIVVAQEKTAEIEKIDKIIDDTRSGGPSGLPHLGAISDAVDRPIEVYDERGRLKYIIGDKKQGDPVKVQYHKPKDGETVGHYTLTNSREPFNQSGTGNMCLYNVVGEQTGHDPNQLKQLSLNIMENNKVQISERAHDITRLEMYSSMKLAMGGVEYSGKHPDDAGRYIANSDGKFGFTFMYNPGHSSEHAAFLGDTDERLKAISAKTNKIIKIYDTEGNVVKTIDERLKKDRSIVHEPVQLVHHKILGDSTSEYFTPLNSEEGKHRLDDPHENEKFYDIIGKQTGYDPKKLRSETSKIMEEKNSKNVCTKNASRQHLKAVSEKTNRTIKIYNAKGDVIDTIDERSNKNSSNVEKPVQLVRHNIEKGSKTEYFTVLNDEDKNYRLHDPRDYTKFYDIIGKKTNYDPKVLRTETSKMMKERMPGKVCVENAAVKNPPKCGFLSKAQLIYVSHFALQSTTGKEAMAQLNEYRKGTKDGKEYRRQAITVKAEDLNLPKPMFAGQWDSTGNLISVWPVRHVKILLQHHVGQQNNKNSEVHIETCYPLEPFGRYRKLDGEDLLKYCKD